MKMKQKILGLLLALLFVGCSKDDSVAPTNLSADLIGDWALTDYHFNGSQRTLSEIDVTLITFSATAWDIGVSAVFIESPNDYSHIGGYNLDVIVVDENGDEFYLPSHRQVNDVGTWTRTNSFLGIRIDDELRQAAISELSETTLKYVISGSESFNDENNDLITITRTDFYTFTRVGN